MGREEGALRSNFCASAKSESAGEGCAVLPARPAHAAFLSVSLPRPRRGPALPPCPVPLQQAGADRGGCVRRRAAGRAVRPAPGGAAPPPRSGSLLPAPPSSPAALRRAGPGALWSSPVRLRVCSAPRSTCTHAHTRCTPKPSNPPTPPPPPPPHPPTLQSRPHHFLPRSWPPPWAGPGCSRRTWCRTSS